MMNKKAWIRLVMATGLTLGTMSCGKIASVTVPPDFSTGDINVGEDQNTGEVNTDGDQNQGAINDGLTGNKDGSTTEGSTGLRDANGTCYADIDTDGVCNEEETDLDGDGLINTVDPDIDNDGTNNTQDTDVDGDGVDNIDDNDIDGDGLANQNDNDIDGDGTPNNFDTDLDGDGVDNIDDNDIDGDGVTNTDDTDIDGDGVENTVDPDTDGDGVINTDDNDLDGDGVDNTTDTDLDGDGVDNTTDTDTDGDGQSNNTDTDANGDGNTDVVPGSSSSGSTGGQLVYFSNNSTMTMDINNVAVSGTGTREFSIRDVRDSAIANDADTNTITLVDVNVTVDAASAALLASYSATQIRMMIYYQLPGSTERVLMGATSDANPLTVASLISGVSFSDSEIQTKEGFLTFQGLIRSSPYQNATVVIVLNKVTGDLPTDSITLSYSVDANGKVKL